MKKVLTLLTICLITISSWAQTEVVFIPGETVGNNPTVSGADQMSRDFITISTTSGGLAASQYRFGKASVTTISSTVGNIIKIEFTCTASGTEKYGPGCFWEQTGYSYEENIGIWTGSSESVQFTAATNQVRASKIVVTIDTECIQLAENVYLNGTILYIGSNVTSLEDLQVNPSAVYSFAAVPPTCSANTFSGYDGTLHIPATSYGAYFTAEHWNNFINISNDAIEPTDVTLSETDIVLFISNTCSLMATVMPQNASLHTLLWTSTNPQVATVNNGKVTALAAGECDIIASCIDKQAVCHVIVTEIDSLALDQTEVTIEQTKQVVLTASFFPESSVSQSVNWSTTDDSIAIVDNGIVTAVGLGECDIIASCLDKQAVCHVTVIETTIHITLNIHDAKLLPNHLLTLTPTMSPLSTELKVTSSDPTVAIARLANGVVQVVGLAEGTAMIIVGSTDGKAVPDTCMVTVYTECGDVNGDGYVNVSDVTVLIDYLLGEEPSGVNVNNADTNRDGCVNVSDVTVLIDYLLGGIDINPPATEIFTVNGVTFTMVEVEGGTFIMGGTDEQGNNVASDEQPTHEVTLSPYYIGQTEVTQALWQAVMGSNPSYFSGDLNRPVETVSWEDCQTFIIKLNELTGKQFHLPTEAEWEFAARGGNKSKGYKYAGSNNFNDVAWCYDNSNAVGSSSPDYGTHIVATKAPNELGLYDMSGNVWEWCQDWYGDYSDDAQTNPTGPSSGIYRVGRGGSWFFQVVRCRVSCRIHGNPLITFDGLGLRLAL